MRKVTARMTKHVAPELQETWAAASSAMLSAAKTTFAVKTDFTVVMMVAAVNLDMLAATPFVVHISVVKWVSDHRNAVLGCMDRATEMCAGPMLARSNRCKSGSS